MVSHNTLSLLAWGIGDVTLNNILERNSFDARSVEFRRLIPVALVLFILAGAWQGLQSHLIHYFGVASLGCPSRNELIRAALSQAGFDLGYGEIVDADRYDFDYQYFPNHGCIAWRPFFSRYPELCPDYFREWDWTTTLTDNRFRLLGTLPSSSNSIYENDITDIDGDGCLEILTTASATNVSDPKVGEKTEFNYWVVLRLKATTNEIIWLALHNVSSLHKYGDCHFYWEETPPDGIKKLVITENQIGKSASFIPDHPGGLLIAEALPTGCGFTLWNPPNNMPVSFDQTACLTQLVLQLLPLPEKPAGDEQQ